MQFENKGRATKFRSCSFYSLDHLTVNAESAAFHRLRYLNPNCESIELVPRAKKKNSRNIIVKQIPLVHTHRPYLGYPD